jgi:hypothetical protein
MFKIEIDPGIDGKLDTVGKGHQSGHRFHADGLGVGAVGLDSLYGAVDLPSNT